MHLTKTDIENTEKIKRLNIINSITGIKPGNLIGSISKEGHTNLAIFSSVVHLGSNPALIGFIMRPNHKEIRDTYNNIMDNGCYTINHIHESFIEKAHYTSAKFESTESEFELCKLTEAYIPDFKAPFVKESSLKMGMKFLDEIPIKINDTVLIIGQIEHLMVPDETISEEGYIDLSSLNTAGIGGLNTYYKLEKLNSFPYARKHELPNFE
ncbi:MAG: flavin reductase [Chitinophagales bacterium]